MEDKYMKLHQATARIFVADGKSGRRGILSGGGEHVRLSNELLDGLHRRNESEYVIPANLSVSKALHRT
jgi:hypothetical protein